MKKTANEYLKEPYSRIIIPEDDGTFSADILEFPGCFAEGQTPDEAYTNLERVAESWIEAALEQGQEIPPPLSTHDFPGRIALRIPRSIHKQAAKFAKMDGTSLNQFFLAAIAARVGAEEFFERLSIRLEAKFMTFETAMPSYTINLQSPLMVTGMVTGPLKMVTIQNFTPSLLGQYPLSSIGQQIIDLSGQNIEEEEALHG